MGNAYDHRCKHVLDSSYTLNPNDPDEIALFGSQQQFMHSIFAKHWLKAKLPIFYVSTQIHETEQNLVTHRKSTRICAISMKAEF